MKTFRTKLKSASPYSQSRALQSKKSRDETHDEFEERCWRERVHADEDGMAFMPPMMFKNCLSEAAKYKSIQIPGKGKATYTKHFKAGVMTVDTIPLGVHVDDVTSERLFVPSDGRTGGSSRVWKNFPLFRQWQADVDWLVFDELIDEDVFRLHLADAGQFIGVGRFRPINNGYYGRFSVESLEVVE